MMRADPAQFDLFGLLSQSAMPMHPTSWDFAAVTELGSNGLDTVSDSMSGYSLMSQGKVLRPFLFRGERWVATGAVHYRGDSDYDCYRVVPLADFAGPGTPQTYHEHDHHGALRPQYGGYHAMQAKHGSADVVLIGPPVIMVHKA